MNYTHNLLPTHLPAWLDFAGRTWDTNYLTQAQLALQGWLQLVYEPENALLGYADPVSELRDGQLVAVAYGLATAEEESAYKSAQQKAQAHSIRNAEKIKRMTSGFMFRDHLFYSDREESIPILNNAVISGMVAMAAGPEAVAAWEAALGAGYRSIDKQLLLHTIGDLMELQSTFTAHGAYCDYISQQLYAEIEAAETVEQIEAISASIPTDSRWPNYG